VLVVAWLVYPQASVFRHAGQGASVFADWARGHAIRILDGRADQDTAGTRGSGEASLAQVKAVNGFPASEVHCLALAVYFEAGNEPREAQIGVGQIALNRARAAKSPRAVCKTVYHGLAQGTSCLFEATCRNLGTPPRRSAALDNAVEVAVGLASGTATMPQFAQATHFHGSRARPAWARSLFKLPSQDRIEFYSDEQPADTVSAPSVTDEAAPVPIVSRRPAVARGDAAPARQASERRDDGGALARQVFGFD
jgi:hypothetical protein